MTISLSDVGISTITINVRMFNSDDPAGLAGIYEVYQYDFPAFGAFRFKVTSCVLEIFANLCRQNGHLTSRGFCSAIASLARRIFAISSGVGLAFLIGMLFML